MDTAKSVCAVIVTYDSADTLSGNLSAIAGQVGHAVVVDNSPALESQSQIKHICAEFKGFAHYLPNPDNNLARAQNLGIKWAKDKDHDWVLLLDDDSRAAPAMVQTMLDVYANHPDRGSIGIIAPYLRDENVSEEPFYYQKNALGLFQRSRFSASQIVLENVMYVCAAGSLIPIHVLDDVGMMNEDFFMYFIDTEFCLRLIQKGYSIIAVREAVLNHQIGKRSEESVLGVKMTTTNHSAQSRYYMARNRLKMWKRFAASETSYVAFDALRSMYEAARIVCFENDKVNKFKAILEGSKDGLLGQSGKKSDLLQWFK